MARIRQEHPELSPDLQRCEELLVGGGDVTVGRLFVLAATMTDAARREVEEILHRATVSICERRERGSGARIIEGKAWRFSSVCTP
jgi:hypothetical protein